MPPRHYVTPTLYVMEDPEAPPVDLAFVAEYLQRWWHDGEPAVTVTSWPSAYRLLRLLGATPEEARHRINFARTGDIYATRTAARRREQRTSLHRS